MKHFINFLPASQTPPPRTVEMKETDRLQSEKDSMFVGKYFSLLIGFISIFVAVSIILKI